MSLRQLFSFWDQNIHFFFFLVKSETLEIYYCRGYSEYYSLLPTKKKEEKKKKKEKNNEKLTLTTIHNISVTYLQLFTTIFITPRWTLQSSLCKFEETVPSIKLFVKTMCEQNGQKVVQISKPNQQYRYISFFLQCLFAIVSHLAEKKKKKN